MASSTNDSGIATDLFQTKVPQIFLCKICNLVPKYPMKVEACSHIFCKGCFHPHRTLAIKNNQPLLCPVDQREIEFHKVTYDEETEVFIGNQPVYCPNKIRGCDWEGPYRNMNEHLDNCEKKDHNRDIREKLVKIEEKMCDKEKQINFLRNNNEVQLSYDIRNQLRKQREESESLAVKVYELTRKTEDENEELKEEVKNLKSRINEKEEENEELKQKQDGLTKKTEEENAELKTEVNNLKSRINEKEKEIEEMKEKLDKTTSRLDVLEQKDKRGESNPETRKGTTNEDTTLLESSINIATYIPNKKPSQVYLDITVDSKSIGRIIIELHHNDAPNNCGKFIKLLNNEPGWGYRGAKIDYVWPYAFRVGEDVMKDATSHGYSIDEFKVPRENLLAKHNQKGMVTLPVFTTETQSRLLITSDSWPSWDGICVIIGHVTKESWSVAEKIWKVPLRNNVPEQEVIISDSGVVN